MYQLTETGALRLTDGASIPDDEQNLDWLEFVAWRDAGGVPTQMPTPEVVEQPPQLTPEQITALANFLTTNHDIAEALGL